MDVGVFVRVLKYKHNSCCTTCHYIVSFFAPSYSTSHFKVPTDECIAEKATYTMDVKAFEIFLTVLLYNTTVVKPGHDLKIQSWN